MAQLRTGGKQWLAGADIANHDGKNGSPLVRTYGSGKVGRGDFKNRGLKAAAAAPLKAVEGGFKTLLTISRPCYDIETTFALHVGGPKRQLRANH
jgi:hypothetical protein